MFNVEDTDNVATGAADFILEGDDEPAAGMGMEDLDDNDGNDSSFNTPAGWAPAASREAWAGDQTSGSAAWDTHTLSQGSAVNIEKAFGAFNGMGNNSMLGGLAYSLPGAQNNLVWSGTMMGVGHDMGNTWQLNDGLPQGWSAPPPDSFQPAGDADDVVQGQGGQQEGQRGGGKGQRSRNRQRDGTRGGSGRSGKNRGTTAETAGAADANSNVSSNMSEAVQVADAQSAPRSGRSGGRAQSGSARSKRGGGDKSGKGQQADSAAGGGSNAGAGAAGKEIASDKAAATAAGGSTSGGKSSRGKMRGAAKVVAVPANIRQAAQDHIGKQRDAVSAPDAPQ